MVEAARERREGRTRYGEYEVNETRFKKNKRISIPSGVESQRVTSPVLFPQTQY